MATAGVGPEPGATEGLLSLNEAAEQLQVHYMTAYRYVRTGRLEAVKAKGQWWVAETDLSALATAANQRITAQKTPAGSAPAASDSPPRKLGAGYAERLRRRATVGDDAGAWAVVTEALASGAAPATVHMEIISPALEQIGDAWASGQLSVAQEHQATAVVQRILGRMTPMFRHRGRRRSTAVLAVVSGDFHGMGTALLADLLTERHFAVVDLGANTPATAIVDSVSGIDGPVAVGLCGTVEVEHGIMRAMIEDLAAAMPTVPLYVGGRLGEVEGPRAHAAGFVAGWARSAPDALDLFEAFDQTARPDAR